MNTELPDAITELSPPHALEALARAICAVEGTPPTQQAACAFTAQWALETGWGKAMHGWNFGNFKSTGADGRDFAFFKCDEILSLAQATMLEARQTPETPCKIVAHRTDGKATIQFFPKHPVARFRAYNTAEAGAGDYCASLKKRWGVAWQRGLAGDVDGFVRALKEGHYFTADLDDQLDADGNVVRRGYLHAVKSIFGTLYKLPWSSVEELHELTQDEKDHLMATVALSLSNLAAEDVGLGRAPESRDT